MFDASSKGIDSLLRRQPASSRGRVYPDTAAPAQTLKAIKADYRRPAALPVENKALANLGRDLFFDTRISASGKTACASCHFPELGYVLTDAHPINDSGKPTSRNSQPLIGLGHAGKALVGWDGRSATLEAQAKSSIATGSMSMRETSTPVKVEIIEERVKSNSGYTAKFNAPLPGRPIDVAAICNSAGGVRTHAGACDNAVRPLGRR
jgi:cytochrome c peroxidase